MHRLLIIEKNGLVFGLWYSDTEVDNFLQLLLTAYPALDIRGNSYCGVLTQYFDTRLRNYAYMNVQLMDFVLRKQVIEALFKTFLLFIANDLSAFFYNNPDADNPIFSTLESMSKGI
jgi:hypothetical protein